MIKMMAYFGYLLQIGAIYATNVAAFSNIEDDVCSKLTEDGEKFNCISTSECSTLRQIISHEKLVQCGTAAGANKVCCPSASAQIMQQGKLPLQKDPYIVAQQKCYQYSDSSYVDKNIPRPFPNGRRRRKPLIFGGSLAELKEFPHMALIGYVNYFNHPDDIIWACGGTLISDRYVLTAAHCMRNGNSEAKWVRLGELVINRDDDDAMPKDFRIAELIPHPQYNGASIYHDIMLLKLDTPVEFTSLMRPICLYTSKALAPKLKNEALITGWGKTGAEYIPSDQLLKSQISLAHHSECLTKYQGDEKLLRGYDPETMICAGDKIEGNDTCEGDSGGPLKVPIPDWPSMYWQVGITSYGYFMCGQKNISSIYTKIKPYIPWIQPIVWP